MRGMGCGSFPQFAKARGNKPYRRNANGYMLTADTMRWFIEQYLAGADENDWRASPLRVERVDGVAPALIVTLTLLPSMS